MRSIVVVPTYNERETILLMIDQLLERPIETDILVVDDNSPDGTADLVKAAIRHTPGRLHLLERPAKQGLGRAYAAGFAHALRHNVYDVVVQMDADGSHDPADVDRLVEALSDADLAVGSRYVPGGRVDGLTGGREVLSRGGNAYARLVLRAGVNDLTGGFKAWRSDLLGRLLDEATASDGYGFQIEMTLRAKRCGARILEIPIVFHERRAGSSKMNWRIASEAAWLVPWLARHYPAGREARAGRRDRSTSKA
jgi:dolichol-phosphate mannosyltransferase